jgi:alpha-tubulin suppressor-like RCC1 family protein
MQWNDSPLVQFGTDSDWKQVIGAHSLSSVLLLKSNGTLWRWGEKTDSWIRRPSIPAELQATAPRRIGTNSDWQELFASYAPMAQRKDGSIWYIGYDFKDKRDAVGLGTNLVPATVAGQVFDPQKVSFGFNGDTVAIHSDGTIWLSGTGFAWDRLGHPKFSRIRCSAETNWTSVALGVNALVALKSDGTLWAWGNQLPRRRVIDAYTAPPVRLGIHDDWRALIPTWKGIIAVAADGSLWLWPDVGTYQNGALQLIEPPDQPIALGNILAAK